MTGFGYSLYAFAADMFATILLMGVFLVTGNIVLAIALGGGAGALQIAWALRRRRPIGAMQWTSMALVALFGAATLFTRDPRFILLKPTVVHLIVGAVMLKPGWMERYVPEAARAVLGPTLKAFGFVWAGLMFLTAALNLILLVVADPRTVAAFNLYFQPTSMIGLFLIQNAWMRRRNARRGIAPAASLSIPDAN